eukprot:scaffold52462_cov71-Phaeocystis_antarctica.AAC.5
MRAVSGGLAAAAAAAAVAAAAFIAAAEVGMVPRGKLTRASGPCISRAFSSYASAAATSLSKMPMIISPPLCQMRALHRLFRPLTPRYCEE